MKYRILALLVLVFMASCQKEPEKGLLLGEWRGEMQVSKDQRLPFNFVVSKDAEGSFFLEIHNADEVIVVDGISMEQDSIIIRMPVFEGYIAGTFSDTTINGLFIKESLERYVPFMASYGEPERFTTISKAKVDVSGIWETHFDFDTEEPYPAKGIFYQSGNTLTGTFRTTTGDYRYLEGVVDGDSLKLSAFDGAHVFLFIAKVTDSTMDGTFFSGNHSVESFKAKRNAAFELPDANSLTYLKEGYGKFEFSFPDVSGKMVSLSDERFQDKVVLVQIMGTWCPNCLDETRFYVDYLRKNPHPRLEFVALAFEYAKTEEKAFEGIERLKNNVGVEYPVLLAQVGTSSKTKANEKLPMLNHVLSYPTTIYIDRKGEVRKIHTGFNGPATGDKHLEFQQEFSETLEGLLGE
ncbi:TlpA family protein disulfide reductase [Muricauda sp. SCSIO 64092]|uniref:peroxiredoxin family protein n=1 Tax=Allomuricauda sp. SCSIO 64092 TaxID=2908842 RepID=UPI001FF688F9|nr:TlpA disulfide reductase family protein [Muricauda sp. SCSIO 64092]UOY06884.1 TlpA family protein disulfide reductase [Muricauda sp. SCSIO 64092]